MARGPEGLIPLRALELIAHKRVVIEQGRAGLAVTDAEIVLTVPCPDEIPGRVLSEWLLVLLHAGLTSRFAEALRRRDRGGALRLLVEARARAAGRLWVREPKAEHVLLLFARGETRVVEARMDRGDAAGRGQDLDLGEIRRVRCEPIETRPPAVAVLSETVLRVAEAVLAAFARPLEVALDEKKARTLYGQRVGELDRTALVRVVTGAGGYRYREPHQPRRAQAVSILVDASGSMRYQLPSGLGVMSRIEAAAGIAYAYALVLEGLGIPSEVLAFGADATPLSVERDEAVLSTRRIVVKRFGECATARRRDFCALPDHAIWENADHDGVGWAVERLLTLPTVTKRRLIVLSDGQPQVGSVPVSVLSRELRSTIERAEARGVRLSGIGIGCEDVEWFYARHEIAESGEEIAAAAFSLLAREIGRPVW